MTDFALCRTCPEITTGRIDSSKGFVLDASSNHNHCDVKPFLNPANLPAPIRNGIFRLGAGLPISDNQAVMFALGLQLEDEWTPSASTAPAAVSTSTPSPAPARESAASTRSPRASRRSSTTPAPGEQLGLDFGDAS